MTHTAPTPNARLRWTLLSLMLAGASLAWHPPAQAQPSVALTQQSNSLGGVTLKVTPSAAEGAKSR